MSDDQAAPGTADAALIAAADAHALRIAVLEARVAKAEAECQAARLDAWPSFAAVRNSNKPQQIASIGGRKLALLTIFAGTPDIRVDENLMMLCVRPHELETFALPGALDDPRVVKLLDEHFPEYVQRRIRPAVRAELDKELKKHDGKVENRNDGEWEQVATITPRRANGRFQCKLEDGAAEVIAEAIDAGLITADGEVPAPSPAGPEATPGPVAAVDKPAAPAPGARAGRTPTDEQAAVIDVCKAGDSLVVEAGAGAGKTSTLAMSAEAMSGRGLYVAYNKAIATDAKGKFPRSVRCSTAHALAMAAVGREYEHRMNGPRVPAREQAQILRIHGPFKAGARLLAPQRVARLAIETVERFCKSADEDMTVWHVPRKPGLDDQAVHAELAGQILPVARRAWDDLRSHDGKLRFDHGHYLKLWQLSHPALSADFIFFDEAQDASPVILDVVVRQTGSQLVAVGDRCQPAGTLVTRVVHGPKGNRWTGKTATVTEEVPIEDLNIGDRVISYDMPHQYLRRGGSAVSGITARPFTGNLVRVQTEAGHVTRYTPDHHCVARFGADINDKHVVYLMRRGDDYRIGVTSGRNSSYQNRVGIVIRASQEGADAAWILRAYDTRREALTAEMTLAWVYGIPDVAFQASNRTTISQEDLDEFWAKVGGNRNAAAHLLHDEGRSVEHPLWSAGGNLWTRRPFVTRACNLMDGMEVLPLTSELLLDGHEVTRKSWTPITVRPETYNGQVYSLTVEGDHTYVGDGIVTHNCQAINGWTGAINAMDKFPAGKRLTLSQSFRFGNAIAREANKWLTLLGSDLRISGFDRISSMVRSLERPEATLCRTNAEAMAEAMSALEAGRATAIVGGGNEVRAMAEAAADLKQGRGTGHPELYAFTTWAEVQDHAENDATGSDLRVMVQLIDEHGPEKIIAMAGQLTDEDSAETVISTAHKAKGREWDSVRIATDFREPKGDPDKAGDPEVSADLAMLAYVAVTRARLNLDRAGLAWVDRYLPVNESTGAAA